jgi:hypothetical protein
MPTVAGTGGNVTLPSGFNVKARDFSATIDIPEADDTGFVDNGWGSAVITGPVRVTGTINGSLQFDAANTAPLPAALMASTAGLSAARGDVTLTFKSGCTWGFAGNITQANTDRAVDARSSLSYNYGSVGQVTQTWDETP